MEVALAVAIVLDCLFAFTTLLFWVRWTVTDSANAELSLTVAKLTTKIYQMADLATRFANEKALAKDIPIEKLISLCHPDKHGNSRKSTEVTQWLLDQR